ncbi:AtpZ/AtpI family protein [Salisaeta longa]|uniref:AtpZ/AtpI family protein n=1 Tax=Salisaeta longa TaxID=503170 RepID=UPI0003B69B43|nr:AtpZ/AtpI family protein [Salisaeta longa]
MEHDDAPGSSEPEPSDRTTKGDLDAWRSALREVMPYLDLGWRLAFALVAPPVAGYWADARWGTTPWLLLVGAALGVAAAGLTLTRVSRDLASGQSSPRS